MIHKAELWLLQSMLLIKFLLRTALQYLKLEKSPLLWSTLEVKLQWISEWRAFLWSFTLSLEFVFIKICFFRVQQFLGIYRWFLSCKADLSLEKNSLDQRNIMPWEFMFFVIKNNLSPVPEERQRVGLLFSLTRGLFIYALAHCLWKSKTICGNTSNLLPLRIHLNAKSTSSDWKETKEPFNFKFLQKAAHPWRNVSYSYHLCSFSYVSSDLSNNDWR